MHTAKKTINSKTKRLTIMAFISVVSVCVIGLMSCSTTSDYSDSNSRSDNSQNKQNTPLQTTVASVDLDKYQGTWYEIARLPMYFQRKCASDVTATYAKRSDGKIQVINKCTDNKGKPMIANGVATVDKKYPQANNSKLLVNFLPESLQWLPVGKGGYWILALDNDETTGEYTHVLVGSPNRKYLWILSRTPNMPDEDYENYLNIAKSQGYDISSLIKTVHTQ